MLRLEVLQRALSRAFTESDDGVLTPRMHRAASVQIPVAALTPPSALGIERFNGRARTHILEPTLAPVRPRSTDRRPTANLSFTLRHGAGVRGLDVIEAAFNRALITIR